jgi:uncharacterized protein (TIGR00645 family)
VQITALNETVIMLVVLALIDVVMISNLLIMVIVGGYETFVSRMNLEDHPDQPEWLSHVNASVLKVKLATAIIGISSIHLLKTFINAANYDVKVLMWQTIIHVGQTFLLSAMAIAYTELSSPIPLRGPLASQRTSLAIFIRLAARVLSAPWACTSASTLAMASNLLGAVTNGRPVSCASSAAPPQRSLWARSGPCPPPCRPGPAGTGGARRRAHGLAMRKLRHVA